MPSKRELTETVDNLTTNLRATQRESVVEYANLTERINSLEMALEDVGWLQMALMGEREFSREGLRQITELARLMYLKNPLIQRGVSVQTDYVFAQGLTIRAKAAAVNEVVQTFLDDDKNRAELTSHQSRLGKETELYVEGNLFFTFFTNPSTGRVRVRTIPFDDIADIICNPDDRKDPWYYKRTWVENTFNVATGATSSKQRTAYYPDWRYSPPLGKRPQTINWDPVVWDSPVYHVKTGGLPSMKFGVSGVYAAIDWARAYKEFLENWATIVKAYARFAFKLSGLGGQTAASAAQTKLASTQGTTTGETNPPPLVASTLLEREGLDFQPIRTAGATTSADDGRRLLLMVAATMGLPEPFFGDVQGTYATADSLDRPTELKMKSRQTLWSDIHQGILSYVLRQAVKAQVLPGTIIEDEDGVPSIELAIDPETGEPMDSGVEVIFPPVLEHSVNESVKAIVSAATLDGNVPAGTIPDIKVLAQMLLQALGTEDIDAALDAMFPEGEQATEADAELAKAARDLREAVEVFASRAA